MSLQQLPEPQLWDEYLRTREISLRNELMRRYVPMLHKLADAFAASKPGCVEAGDAFGDGAIGMKMAVERFDPARGVKFATYAARRINGAMLDGLRVMDWVPRLARSRGGPIVKLGSIESVVADDGAGRTVTVGMLAPDPDAAAGVEQMEMRDRFEEIIRPLGDRTAKLALRLYYLDGMRMSEVGRTIGMSESRISQILSSALKQLKARGEDGLA